MFLFYKKKLKIYPNNFMNKMKNFQSINYYMNKKMSITHKKF